MNQKPRSTISIPNIITCFRLVLIPLFILSFFRQNYFWTVVCLILSGLSDVADGYIARRFGMITELGKLLDPVADKLTQGAVFVCLAVRNPVMWTVFGLLALKELVMSIWGWVGVRRTGHMISALWYGKACSSVLYLSMAVMVLVPGLSRQAVNAIAVADVCVIVLTLVLYSVWYIRYLRSAPAQPEQVSDRDEASASIAYALTALVIVLLLICAAVALLFREHISLSAIVNFTPKHPWLAVLVFLGLYAAKSLTSVVYVKLLYLAAGVVFSLPAALAVGVAGTVVELMLPYVIGLSGGGRTAELLLERSPKLRKLRDLRTNSNFWFTAFVRASGIVPMDPASIYFGACRMPVIDFLCGSVAGILPTLVIATLTGALADDPASSGFILSAGLFIVVQLGCAVAFVLWIRRHYPAGEPAQKEVTCVESSQ